jgi:pyruvate-ferredoxin/flavodoxin oxidoreductase
MIHLDDMLVLVTQDDTVRRHVLDPAHPAYVPDFGIYIEVDNGEAGSSFMALSRQMVLFCVERRKAWRMMQSRAGVTNLDYEAQKAVRIALGEAEEVVDRVEFATRRYQEELAALYV